MKFKIFKSIAIIAIAACFLIVFIPPNEVYGMEKTSLKSPTQLKAEKYSTSAIDLSWKKVKGANGYIIYKYNPKYKKYYKIKIIKNSNIEKWRNKKLSPGKTYGYKIKSYKLSKNNVRYSKPSLLATAKTFKHEYGVFIGLNRNNIYKLYNYKTVVIDAEYFTSKDIKKLHNNNQKVYSYLNIGSIEKFRSYYNTYKNITLGKYQNWDDERWINVSNKDWQSFIVNKTAKTYLNKGVDGFFVDNCDVYYLYKNEGIFKGLTNILKSIKSLNTKIIINGGDTFIKEYLKRQKSSQSIFDGINQETVFTTINFSKNTFGKSDYSTRTYYISYFKKLIKNNKKIFLLEYTTNTNFMKKIISYCKKKGWYYYISRSIELN